MFLLITVCIILGVCLGVVTGLIPGIHPNTVFVLLLSALPLLAALPVQCVMVFVVSLAITNTFTDFIPSLIIGAPDPSTALSVMPGHMMLLAGRGYEALLLTAIGGLSVTVVTLLAIPFLLVLIPALYGIIHGYLHILLLIITVPILLSERGKDRLYALAFFLFAGLLGTVTLNSSSSGQVLFPALSGLFGMSAMFMSFMCNTRIPSQEIPSKVRCNYARGTAASWFSALLVGLLPGVGSSHAGIISSHLFRNDVKENLMALGGINTANMFFTLIVLYAIGKTRSGTSWMISQIADVAYADIILICLTCLVSSCLAVIAVLLLGKTLMKRAHTIPYRRLLLFAMSFITAMAFLLGGLFGLLVLFTCSFTGISCSLLGIKKTHLMGFLIMPTILYFSGMNIYLLEMMGM